MGLFSSILEKLGLVKRWNRVSPRALLPYVGPQAAPIEKPAVVAISQVDVVAKLEGLAASNQQKLNWKTSIVDLLKLLGSG